MPFLGVDSWRWQYFAGQPCPDHVVVPIDDATAWDAHPEFRRIYNKLFICDSQGLPNGPHGTMPPAFPVFSKPIYNMRGMGTGSRVIASAAEYELAIQPGHLWMPLLEGEHVSTDMALADGSARWVRHATGVARGEGTFDYWIVHAEPRPALEAYLREWAQRNLRGFTGIVNFETIGGHIIECHLRMSEQWLDLNGAGWLASVVALYTDGFWRFDDGERRTGYSVVLFGAHGVAWQIDRGAVRDLLRTPGVSSIQITFDDDIPREAHAMPPGGFRLAIVNCWDLAVGKAVRAELDALFAAASAALLH
ncbi:MAG TPA: hypothetical protein VFA50_01570 [Stellaceae bacterium]|nr:hypothetical protein [Stellaceae bacterium]